MKLTRQHRRWFVTSGILGWMLGVVFLLTLLPWIIGMGILGISILLATGWTYRRRPVLWGAVGTVGLSVILIAWNVNLVRDFGWTGVWTAAIFDLVVCAGFVLLGHHVVGTTEPDVGEQTPNLSESERIRREQNWS